MKNKKILGLFAVLFCFGLALTSCNKKDDPEDPKVEHKCHHVCPTCGKCKDDSCTDPVCAAKCECGVTPTQKEITGISLDIPETTEYRLSENLSDIVLYCINFNDGSKTTGNSFVEEDFSAYTFENGKVKSTATVEIKSKTYTLDVELPIQEAKQVHEVKENAAFKGTVEGLYVAKQIAASRVTIALWDKEANALMNVNFYDVAYEDLHIEEADLLRLPVDAGVFDGTVARFENCVISHGNDISTWDGETSFPTATSVELLSQPDNVNYTHKNTLDDIDLFGAKIKVKYSDNSEYVTDVTKEMLTGTWCIGECQYTVSYEGLECATKLVVNYIPTGISLSEFYAKDSGTFDVECIVVGAQTVYGTSELLVKDVNTNALIGIWNTGVTGAWNGPALDTNYVNVGDKIIVPLEKLTMGSAGADTGKVYANCGSFKNAVVVLEHNCPITYNLEDENIIKIQTQDEFKAWVEGDTKFYQIAELVNPRVVIGTAADKLVYPFFDPYTTGQTYTYGGLKLPLFAPRVNYELTIGVGTIDTFFKAVPGETYYQCQGNLFILYQGGNAYQHVIDILDPSWFVPAELTGIEIDPEVKVCLADASIKDLGIKYRTVYSNETYGKWTEIPQASFGTQETKDGKIVCPVSVEIEGKTYTKEISLTIVSVDHIELESAPTVTYDHNTKLETLDVTGGKIKVFYEGGTSEVIPLTLGMVSGDAIKLGENTLVITYCGKTCQMKINVVSTAISLEEFYTKESGTYDVECLVVGAQTVYGHPELLVKDVNTNAMIGIWNTGVTGAWNAPVLNTNYVNVGDKIIVPLEKLVMGSAGADTGKTYANCGGFTNSVIIVESNCPITYNLNDEKIVRITNQDDFKAWVESDTKFYQIAELVYPRVVVGTAADKLVYPFFAPCTASQTYTYGGITKSLFAGRVNYEQTIGVGTIDTFFEEVPGQSYLQCNGSLYIMFQGGNAYQHVIDILDPSWFVPATVEDVEFDLTADVCPEGANIADLGIKYRKILSNGAKTEWTLIPTEAFGTQTTQDGKYVCAVTLAINEKTFNKQISLTIVNVERIEVETLPTTAPNQRTTIETLDLTGGELKVYYQGGNSEVIPLSKATISGDAIQLGENTLLVTYCGKTCEMTITAVSNALTIEAFKTQANGTYDVECIVIGAQTVYGSTELLVKDVNSNEMIGIWNTGITGAWNAPVLDETVLKKGDRVILSLERAVRGSGSGADTGKVYANCYSITTTTILIAHNCPVTYDLTDEKIVRITTQEQFEAWVEGDTKFYQIAELVNPRVTISSTADALVRPFFDPCTAPQTYTYGGVTVSLFASNVNYNSTLGEGTINTFFESVQGQDYLQCNGSLYVMFQGGNAYQHVIDILDPSWFVPAAK